MSVDVFVWRWVDNGRNVTRAKRRVTHARKPWDPELFCAAEALWVYHDDSAVLFGVFAMSEFDDVFSPAPPRPAAGSVACPEFYASHPRLARLMTVERLPSGAGRQTATLIALWEDGQFKGGLRDRDGDRSLWRSAGSVAGLLDALEEALAEQPVDWRKAPKVRR